MALLDSEGFGMSTAWADFTSYTGWSNVNSAPAVATAGPLGDNYITFGASAAARRQFAAAIGTFFLGFRIACDSLRTTYVILEDASGAELFHIQVSTTGQLSVFRNTTQLGSTTAAGTVPVGSSGTPTWCYMEIGAQVSATVGVVTVQINSAAVFTTTGVNNTNSGSTTMQFISWGDASGLSRGPDGLTHVYLCDNTGSAPWNTFLGDVRVQTLLPASNDTVAFTPVGLSANWQNASAVPPVPASDYNSDATLNAQDTFNCGAMATGLVSVYGVNTKVLALKSDAGTRNLETVLKSGATTVTGVTTPMSTSAKVQNTMYQTDPNTSTQWAQAAVNAAKPGYKISL